jgi:hypothetical protein
MRHNTGDFAGAAIWAYAPRPGFRVSNWCRELMDHYEVRLIEEPLNAAHADYPLANKPLALAHAEQHATTEYVIFLDTDILAWKPPVAFLLPAGTDIALVPDGTKTTASSGPGDPFEEYWQRLYALVGARERPFVRTTLTNEYVRGTWNSGVVPLRRATGIAQQWSDAMRRLMAEGFAPQQAAYLRENNLLSALAAAHWDRYQELPVTYNYPIQSSTTMGAKGFAPEDAVLWHYQPFFDKAYRRFAHRIDGASNVQTRIALTEALVRDLRINHRKRVGIDESWLNSLRRRVRLGPRLRAAIGRPKPTDLQRFD